MEMASTKIIIAEDDNDDYEFMKCAFKESGLQNEIYRVKNGKELVDFLLNKKYVKNQSDSCLVLLDLNMPIMDGREALKEIKSHPELKRIPIIVLTTSNSDQDIMKSYDLGVNSYIKKPLRYEDLLQTVNIFKQYWLKISEIPTIKQILTRIETSP